MTSETYKRVMGILTDQEIYNFAERLCDHYKFDPLKMYPQKVNSEVMRGAASRMLYLHKASNLLRRAVFLGGTNLEIFKMAQYLVVIMKSVDHKLDFRLCEQDMGIPELERKYNENEFLSLDVDAETLENVIKRDNGFYEVNIK